MAVIAALGLAIHAPAWSGDQQVTIAALGDSLVQGFGLPREQGFTVQLDDG